MVAPDVQIEDGKGTILISSEEGETEGEPVLHQQTCREQFTACFISIFLSTFLSTVCSKQQQAFIRLWDSQR